MSTQSVYLLLSWSVILIQCGYGFELPVTSSSIIARYASITTTSSCTNGGPESCNTDCPTRTSFPTFQKTIESISSNCTEYDGDSPNESNIANGGIEFNASTSDCQLYEEDYKEVKQHFTITMWVKATTNTNVFSIGTLNLIYQANTFTLNTISESTQEDWNFIAIRYNGALGWFVNGIKVDKKLNFSGLTTYNVKLGPDKGLSSGSLIIVDVRWYSAVVTDREIAYLYSGTENDFCRCPSTHPAVVKETLPILYMKCTDGKTEVSRLGENAFIPEYMTDDNATTKWVSGIISEVNITLKLKQQFQIKSITLDGKSKILNGISNTLTSLHVILLRSEAEVQVVELRLSNGTASYNFEANTIITRTQYTKIIADKVIVKARLKSGSYLTVSDLKLEARCSCYGNDKNCKITNDSYECNCDSTSYTINSYCEECKNFYFRSTEQFKCESCKCNTIGSSSEQCEKIGGQCKCLDNIEGRQCLKCMHNSANFSSNGCTNCSCNPDGIIDCSDDLTCNCKQNVEQSSGMCRKCLPNYYHIASPSGCTSCECDISGTKVLEPKCESGNGQCYCKSFTEGRTCNKCKNEYFGLSANITDGCEACMCNIVGSNSLICDKVTGQCPCVDGGSHTDDQNRQCIPGELKLEPLFGPKAGNTTLTITGTLLGDKAFVTLTIGGEEQPIIDRNVTAILFSTTDSAQIGEKSIALKWTLGDNKYIDENFNNATQTFQYKKNPQMIVRNDKRVFASGGCILHFTGTNLDSVAHPKMRVYLANGDEEQTLCVSTKESLSCPTPQIKVGEQGLNLSYGFWQDGVMTYVNVTRDYSSKLTVVKDPKIYSGMSETFRNTFDDIFKVKGERLNEACHDSDFTITLGDKNCAILSRHNDVITCDPGESFPGSARSVTVKVKIGNIEVVWGTLKINSFWTNTEFIYMAVGAAVFLIAIIVIVVCIVRCRRGQSDTPDDSIPLEIGTQGKARPNDYSKINPVAVIQPNQTIEAEPKTSKEISDEFCKRLLQNVGKVVNSSVIERSNIDPGKVCTHKGKKIRVINGQYNASTSSPYSGSSLTIKTLLEKYPEEGDLPDWLNNGLLECTRLRDFDHANVLRMKGIAIDAKNIYILYPEMSNKTLKDYLIANVESLDAEKKTEICIRVCEGMNYLSTQSIVHKDLAARNCWVSRDFEVKISDASFSYDIYPDEYLHSNGRYQPVRWMAPESLRQGFYDTKSDVWSYGVLIWEVFTNGYLPYFDITDNAMVKTKVCDDHFRLGKPHECHDSVFTIISECQKDKSDERPNFFILQNLFDNIIDPGSSPVHYANQEQLAGNETGMEDYENLGIVVPPRPPKGRRP